MDKLWASFKWFFAKFWTWPVVSFCGALASGLGAGALSIDQYIIASALFFVAVLLITAKALTWKDTKAHHNRKYISALIVVAGLGVFILSLWWVEHRSQRMYLNGNSGYLIPAHDPDKTTCREDPELPSWVSEQIGPLPDGVVAVFLGKSRYYATNFPYHPLQYEGKPVVTIDRDEAGKIGVTVDVRSKDGKIVTQIKNGRFIVNPNNMLTMKRKDESTLVVVDQYGNEVLNVRYQNNRVIHFQGTLYLEGRESPVIVRDDLIDLGRATMTGLCYSYGPLTANMSSTIYR